MEEMFEAAWNFWRMISKSTQLISINDVYSTLCNANVVDCVS